MGFFDTVGNIAKVASEKIEEKANEINQVRQKLEQYSDDRLLKMIDDDSFFGSSSMEKNIAKKILSDRGISV